MKKFLKWTLAILTLAVYLNIGWAFGTYYTNNVIYAEPDGFVAQIAAGGWAILSDADTYSDVDKLEQDKSDDLLLFQILFSTLWPIVFLVIGGTWLTFGAWKLFWLLFAGGIAKSFGVG